MKNATKHADDLKSLFKRLLKEGKVEPREAMDPLKALVRGAMSFDVSDARADDAMRAIEKEFVDLNELRVATDLEIQELLGVRYPAIERRVAMITQSLNTIFEKEHVMSLERLRTVSKRDARQFLRELPDSHPFVEAFVMLHAFDGNAMPMDDQTVSLLVEHEIVEEETSLEEAQKFVEHHIKAEDVYDFFRVARRAAEKSGDAESPKKRAR
jgi:endonuclease III